MHSSSISNNSQMSKGVRIRDKNGYRLRAACVCVRDDTEKEVLLVTSRSNPKNWTVPGGGIEDNENSQQAAVREVEEEAGVKGSIIRSIGLFTDERRKHKTSVYLLRVSEEMNCWDDLIRVGRCRHWFSVEEAYVKIRESERPYLREVKPCGQSVSTAHSASS